MTESMQTPDQVQPATKSTQMPDQAAQTLKDCIATAVKLLRRMGEDLEGIQSTLYLTVTALRAPDGDAMEDAAIVLDGAYVKLVEDVDDDIHDALKALDQAGRACGDDVTTSRDHSDV